MEATTPGPEIGLTPAGITRGSHVTAHRPVHLTTFFFSAAV
jgi:hypothetical protein